jgi:hypothetical protein
MVVDGCYKATRSGICVSAEIKTGNRRLIEYLLSPVMRAEGSEEERAMRQIGLTMILPMFAVFLAASAQCVTAETQFMNPFLAEPIATDWIPTSETRAPVFSDVLRSRREPTIILLTASDHASLLIGVSRSGFGAVVPISVKGYLHHLVEGSDETLWVAGVSKIVRTIGGAPRSHAYLAKVDRLGHFFWDREFGEGTERTIDSIVSLPSGGIVVSGRDDDTTWLARISNDGKIIWERVLGLGKGSAVTAIHGRIVLAALDSVANGTGYQEDVVAWTFTEDGMMIHRRIVRNDINNVSNNYYADIRMESVGGAVYVFSAWMDSHYAKPLGVTKLYFEQDQIAWRREIPLTVWHDGDRTIYSLPAISVLSNGDALISIPIGINSRNLSRLNAADGDLTQTEVNMSPPPSRCAGFWGPIRFLKEQSRTTIWMFGSPPQSERSKACGWVGEAVMPDPK